MLMSYPSALKAICKVPPFLHGFPITTPAPAEIGTETTVLAPVPQPATCGSREGTWGTAELDDSLSVGWFHVQDAALGFVASA